MPWDESFIVNERFVWVRCRGIPLHLWSRHYFESVGELVGKVVEVDQATVARNVLEYVRVRVCIPVGVLLRVKKVSINGLSCVVSFKEETYMSDYKLRSFFSKWGDVSAPESDVSLEDDGRRERLVSVGSYSNDKDGRRVGEEQTVQCIAARVGVDQH